LDIARFKYGVVTLIPKGKDVDCIQKYKSIFLMNVIFKNFTKVLVNRLVEIIWKLIKISQTAFLEGGYILEGVVLMYEILNEMHIKRYPGVLFKTDFEKPLIR
jgi:hypothetical protein